MKVITIKPKKFYKGILILLIIVLLTITLFPKFTLAQEVNYCLTGVATFNKISLAGSAGGVNWIEGASDITDNDSTTYMGFGDVIPAGGDNYVGEFEGIVTFGSIVPEITRVHYDLSGFTDGHTTNWIVKTYLWAGGIWNEIDSRKFGSYGGVDINGNWHNVEKVKVYIWAQITTQCLKVGGCQFYRHLGELEAFGPSAYQDIGLRVYNGTNTVAIAAEPTGTLTSPLRIAKNGVIYGVALVNPGDPDDSGVRIQTSSGVKALRKLFSY